MNAALLRLILAQICIHGCMTGMRMATPLLALREGYSAAAVGMLLALFALTQVFLSAGRALCRSPRAQAPLDPQCGGCELRGWFGGDLPALPGVCASALLTGGAAGTALIALQRHVGRMAHNKEELRKVFSWLAIGPAISNFLGPFAAGLLIDYAGGEAASDVGFRAAFVLLALMPLAAWFWARTVQELPPVQVSGVGKRPRPGICWRTEVSGVCCC